MDDGNAAGVQNLHGQGHERPVQTLQFALL